MRVEFLAARRSGGEQKVTSAQPKSDQKKNGNACCAQPRKREKKNDCCVCACVSQMYVKFRLRDDQMHLRCCNVFIIHFSFE